jgi:hypothetical protein
VFAHHGHNDTASDNAKTREQPALPTVGGCQKTKGSAFVVEQCQIKDGQYFKSLCELELALNNHFAGLISQHDEA